MHRVRSATMPQEVQSPGETLMPDGSIPVYGALGHWLVGENDVVGSDYKARDVILGKVEGKKKVS